MHDMGWMITLWHGEPNDALAAHSYMVGYARYMYNAKAMAEGLARDSKEHSENDAHYYIVNVASNKVYYRVSAAWNPIVVEV